MSPAVSAPAARPPPDARAARSAAWVRKPPTPAGGAGWLIAPDQGPTAQQALAAARLPNPARFAPPVKEVRGRKSRTTAALPFTHLQPHSRLPPSSARFLGRRTQHSGPSLPSSLAALVARAQPNTFRSANPLSNPARREPAPRRQRPSAASRPPSSFPSPSAPPPASTMDEKKHTPEAIRALLSIARLAREALSNEAGADVCSAPVFFPALRRRPLIDCCCPN